MSQLFNNNASGTLSVQAETGHTTLTLQTGEAGLFPSPSGEDFAVATIEDTSGNIEIVKITSNGAPGTDVLTVTRAQENTAAQQFATGSRVELRVTAGTFDQFIQKAGDTMTGELNMNNEILRDPIITDGESRGLIIKGSDGGSTNAIFVPAGGAAPTIGGSNTIIHTGNDDAYALGATTITAGPGIGSGLGDLSQPRTVNLDISGLPALEGNEITTTEDGYLVDNNGAVNRMSHTDAGVPVSIVSGSSYTLGTVDMNTFIEFTNNVADPIPVTLDTGIGKVGNWVVIKQGETKQVSIIGSAGLEASIGTKTRTENSVIILFCAVANTWTVYGDAVA